MRGAALALAVAAGFLGGCTRPMVIASQQDKKAHAAFQAGRYDECIELYNDAIQRYQAWQNSYPTTSASHWWGVEWAAQSRMGRAHCYRAQGKLAAAVADLETAIKVSLEANENDKNTLQSIQQKTRDHAANMSETLAKWKKELAAQDKK